MPPAAHSLKRVTPQTGSHPTISSLECSKVENVCWTVRQHHALGPASPKAPPADLCRDQALCAPYHNTSCSMNRLPQPPEHQA